MKLILICLLSINLFHLYSSGDNTYPAYESVVERFYKSHSFEQYSQRTYLRLEKRPTGWYTLFLKYDPELRILHTELFWDAQSKSYKNLDTTSNSSVKWREAPRLDPFLNHDFDKECYKLLPYYGYTGWDNDLIKAYENKEDLSDSLLLALAFAYSVYS
ncbi:MAG TPA: hypothetical protein VL947_12905, partial [Cytophagales bacterium]|nr:hypothetical protein [Cytophagales bacterium]